jgi:Fic family protein
MKKLINDHSYRLSDNNLFNPILEACLVSALIVKIHPFGDFNGRTSRIVLNVVLNAMSLPFYISLRSNSSHKKKYIMSVSHFFSGGRLRTYLSLVCKAFFGNIEKINKRLILAGIEPFRPVAISDEEKQILLDKLNKYLEIARKC